MLGMEAIVTFGLYLVVLLGIGIHFYRKTEDIASYLLAGRSLGSWVTALSAQASDMSGWLLMGLPGAIFLGGMKETWIAIGLLIGTFCNWTMIASRLRVYTEQTNALTLPTFFEERFKDPKGLLRIVSSLITIGFFTMYASSGLVASGKLFESMFKLDYYLAVTIGGAVIIGYTFLGGYAAVCWTDFIQGSLMLLAIVVVPAIAYSSAGGSGAVGEAITRQGLSTSILMDGKSGLSALAIISTMAWGLGYFGQPHILARFMGIRSARDIPKSTTIAMVWVTISLAGAVLVGLVAIAHYPQVKSPDHEKVFIYLIRDLFNPWLAGIMLAAILSAIMSTIDSQLLVSSSTLTEDVYRRGIRPQASEKELILVGRLCVLGVSAVAYVLALDRSSTVLGLVSYAWGGFGAAFGPLLLAALFSRRTTWQAALGGMVMGTVVLVLWKQMGWGASMYEIVPGFIANGLTIVVVNLLVKQSNSAVTEQFDEFLTRFKNRGRAAAE